MKHCLWMLTAVLVAWSFAANAADIRRISLDGRDRAPAPVATPGKDGIDRIQKVETPCLELFATAQQPAKGTILLCPGGGYRMLAIHHEGYAVAKMLNEIGYDVALLIYHVNVGDDTRELAIADAKQALALLQERGEEFGLSTKSIGVMGFSAGGHLAARLTHATAEANPPDFAVLMYPAYLEKDGTVIDEVAPVKTPAFVYVAADDKYAPSSDAYAAACAKAGVPCTFTKTERGGHGFGLKEKLPDDVKDWPDKLRAFLDPVKPNVIFILSDDLAQGDVGAYGQKLIQTPVLDRMAREGMRFTQAYCGTSVCAPSRTSLMIGKHMGHSPVRANREIKPEGQFPLPKGTFTVAELFKSQGYATAAIGKWGMGMFDTTGSPLEVGFDHFYGYNCQRHAHSYFPAYLYDDDRRFELPGNDGKGIGKTYAQELIAADTVKWITANRDKPFFLYYAITLPHGRHEIDSQGIYADKDWTPLQKNYAAQVTRLDSDIGRILDTLAKLGLDDQTLVIMAGDNGSSFPGNSEIGTLFDQTMGGKLRGFKRGMYEGALRQACIARWPGVIPAGKVCDEPWAFWDFLPTCAEILNTKLPDGVTTDGLSILPLLEGGNAPKRDFFYWELHEGPTIQAARFGDIKAVRNGPSAPIEIYDLSKDTAETNDLAKDRPDLVAQAETIMAEARVDDPNWPLQGKRSSGKAETKKARQPDRPG